jgi:hypothetical protein
MVPSPRARLATVAAGLAVSIVVVSCGSGTDRSSRSAGVPDEAAVEAAVTSGTAATAMELIDPEQVPESPLEDGASGLDAGRNGDLRGLPEPAVSLLDLRAGGPPPDGIPPIDRPLFRRAVDVDGLADVEPVLAFEIDGDVRAYPVRIMIWHEIVNDTVAGVPVAITYCPLCNSAVAYDRRVGERVVSFGTSGLLWNSALVMYDRQTESLWSHFTGEAIVGRLTGASLATLPVATIGWAAWRDAHPDGLVLDADTGFDRDYGRNPYPGYDDISARPFLYDGEVDGRYAAMTRVVGIELDGEAAAVPLAVLRDLGVVEFELAAAPVTVWWQPGTASALDTPDLAGGADVGSTSVFRAEVDGRRLTFRAEPGGAVDIETGSRWDRFGRVIEGPLLGSRLRRVAHVDTFWFAWGVFRPDGEVIDGR